MSNGGRVIDFITDYKKSLRKPWLQKNN
jgi:hypothetical protein